MPTKTLNREELITQLEEAQAKLYEAIENLEQVARATHDSHADAYLIAHLKILAGSDHGYLSNDFNLDAWIKQIREQDTE